MDALYRDAVRQQRLPRRVYVYGADLLRQSRQALPWMPCCGEVIDDRGSTEGRSDSHIDAITTSLLAQHEEDPSAAELFFIPHHRHFKLAASCSNASSQLVFGSLAQWLGTYWHVRESVDYLRRHEARDHFTVVYHRLEAARNAAMWRYVATAPRRAPMLRCDGASPWEDDSSPSSLQESQLRAQEKLGAQALLFNVTTLVTTLQSPWMLTETRASAERFGHRARLVEIPFMGSVHDATLRQPDAGHARTVLISAAFADTGHYSHRGQMELRHKLLSQCNSVADELCQTGRLYEGGLRKSKEESYFPTSQALASVLDLYRRSAFCLQPAGDDPSRKGTVDALLSGCIPVFFHEESQALWPLHWGQWVRNASVLVPHDTVMVRNINVVDRLRAVPTEHIARMQQVIGRMAHTMAYTMPDGNSRTRRLDEPEDALDITLRFLATNIPHDKAAAGTLARPLLGNGVPSDEAQHGCALQHYFYWSNETYLSGQAVRRNAIPYRLPAVCCESEAKVDGVRPPPNQIWCDEEERERIRLPPLAKAKASRTAAHIRDGAPPPSTQITEPSGSADIAALASVVQVQTAQITSLRSTVEFLRGQIQSLVNLRCANLPLGMPPHQRASLCHKPSLMDQGTQ